MDKLIKIALAILLIFGSGFYAASMLVGVYLSLDASKELYQHYIYTTTIFGQSLGRWSVLLSILCILLLLRRRLYGAITIALIEIWSLIRSPEKIGERILERYRAIGLKTLSFYFITTIVLPVFLSAVAFEAFTRWQMFIDFKTTNKIVVLKNNTLNPSMIDEKIGQDTPQHPDGLFKANSSLTTWFYDVIKNSIPLEYTVKTNNMGYLSEKTYNPVTSSDTYNIIILGDSFTGTTTMSIPWVDTLGDILSKDEGLKTLTDGKPIATYNLGWPGAGFAHFLEAAIEKAPQFSPDLIVVNYIEGDFSRLRRQRVKFGGNKKLISGFISVSVDGTRSTTIHLPINCTEPPMKIENPDCYQHYNFFVPKEFELDVDIVKQLYEDVTARMLSGKSIWTLYPYGYYRITDRLKRFNDYRQPEYFRFADFSEPEMIEHAASNLRQIRDAYPNILITLNPNYSAYEDFKRGRRLTNELVSSAPDISITIMQDHLPHHGKDLTEIKSWYNLPYDGHMSTLGGQIYAKAMAQVIKQHLITSYKDAKGQ